MHSKNEIKILLLSLFLSIIALGGGGWLLWRIITQKTDVSISNTPIPSTNSTPTTIKSESTVLTKNLSNGEKWLIAENITPTKQAAAEAFSAGNYPEAIAKLEEAIQEQPNDPEALIYLNNARIAEADHYSIAVVVPVGTEVNGAKEILRGVAQAQDEINRQGGINGIPLKVGIVNDDNNSETGVQVAEILANQPEILGVIGHFSSEVTLATQPVYQDKNLVVISPTSTSVDISGTSNYLFRTVPSDHFTGNALAKYMLENLKLTKAALFYNSGSNYSKSLRNVVTTALFNSGGEVVFEGDFASDNFNAIEAVKQVQEMGAHVLIFVSNTATLDQALEVIQVNEQRLPILAGDSLYNPHTLQVGRRDAVGMVVAIPWHIYSNRDSEFAQNSTKLWKGDVNWRTAMSYDATKALIRGIEINPTRIGVQEALSDPSFLVTGSGKDIRFLPSGDRNQSVQLVKIESAPDTDFGYRFFPIE